MIIDTTLCYYSTQFSPLAINDGYHNMDQSRRHFLKSASLYLSSGLLFCCFPLSFAFDDSLAKEKYLRKFAHLSAVLTGKNDLSPELLEQYFAVLCHHENKPIFIDLLNLTNDARTDSELNQFLSQRLKKSDKTSALARKIIKMWYCGTWDNKTISVAAYQKSLLWRTFSSTPPGVPNGMIWQFNPSK
ncbi:MAG: hypothetical protein JO149_08145 [Gammaproteobacteria bacterium]|nr:hypothetical protein [Gammaproteobacteria bacterium]